MDLSEQQLWEFYDQVLRELGIENKIYHEGDKENIFDEAFKMTFGFFPDEDIDD